MLRRSLFSTLSLSPVLSCSALDTVFGRMMATKNGNAWDFPEENVGKEELEMQTSAMSDIEGAGLPTCTLGGSNEQSIESRDTLDALNETEQQYQMETDSSWANIRRPKMFEDELPVPSRRVEDPNERLLKKRRPLSDADTEELELEVELAQATVKRAMLNNGSLRNNPMYDKGSERRIPGFKGISDDVMKRELTALNERKTFSVFDDQGRLQTVVAGKDGKLQNIDTGRISAQSASKKEIRKSLVKVDVLDRVGELQPAVEGWQSEHHEAEVLPQEQGPEVGHCDYLSSLSLSTSAAQQKKLIRYDWDDLVNNEEMVEHRKELRETLERLRRRDVHVSAPSDSYAPKDSERTFNRAAMRYYKQRPINRMIQSPHVLIAGVRHPDGHNVVYPEDEREAMELKEALDLAAEHGLDLIQVDTIEIGHESEKTSYALCIIDDHKLDMSGYLEFHVPSDTVRTPVKECFEVGFRGGTHPWAISVKARFIAKFLIHRHPIRISLREFGTAREGFPILEMIFGAIKKECLQMKAFHITSRVNATYDEISCYLHPDGERVSTKEIVQPSPEELNLSMEQRLLDEQREIHIDNIGEHQDPRDAARYEAMVANGTAWTVRDPGLSLREQRRLKIRLGWIPKSNSKLYGKRGDTEFEKGPFSVKHKTSMDSWFYPRISNIEQATNGASVLGARYDMPIAEMYDKNELPSEPSTVARMHYRVGGDAMLLGELKKGLGLKRCRKNKPPKFAPGTATLGVNQDSGAR